MDVSKALTTRRAIKNFDPEHKVSDQEYQSLMELVLTSPTSFNIQNWRFVNVVDTEKREAIKAAAWGQAQVTDASLLFLLCADVKAWEKDPARYWRNAPKETADLMVSMIGPFYEGRESLQRDEAMRSVGIAAQSMMLAAREMGYDTCPMIGFDQEKVAEIINLPDDHVIGMMVTLGKRTKEPFPRGGDISFEEAVITDSF